MTPAHNTVDVGVIVGRFQTNELHPGHRELIDYVTAQHAKVIIAVGVARAIGTRENPLDYQARERMLRAAYPDVLLTPLNDMATDDAWSKQLDNVIRVLLAPGQTALLYGSRDSFIPHYQGSFATQSLHASTDTWSATAARDAIRRSCGDSADFRAGVIWSSSNRYPAVIPTVDIACFNKTGQLLLAKRASEAGWRLPGGFADVRSESFLDDAKRELREECGALETDSWQCVGSQNIADWRYRGRDVIRTTLFRCRVLWGEPVAADDIDQVKWVSVPQDPAELDQWLGTIVQEHRNLIRMAVLA